MMMRIKVMDVVEHPEDGSATYTFEADGGSQKVLSELGIKFLLYCAAAGISTEDALANIIATIESREE